MSCPIDADGISRATPVWPKPNLHCLPSILRTLGELLVLVNGVEPFQRVSLTGGRSPSRSLNRFRHQDELPEPDSKILYLTPKSRQRYYVLHWAQCWNIDTRITQSFKNSSNFLYDVAHGKKSLRGLFSWAAKRVICITRVRELKDGIMWLCHE
jgi:hypothetical protein